LRYFDIFKSFLPSLNYRHSLPRNFSLIFISILRSAVRRSGVVLATVVLL